MGGVNKDPAISISNAYHPVVRSPRLALSFLISSIQMQMEPIT